MTVAALQEFANPFPGLRPFEATEEHLFFGREQQIDEVLRRLRTHRLVAVAGTSGCGKSSLIRAGVLPALYGGLIAGLGSHWRIALMRPGSDPYNSLARALRAAGIPDPDDDHIDLRVGLVEAVLRRGALGLVEIAAESSMEDAEHLLVVVDQFEELFRYHSKDAAAFVKLLLNAAEHDGKPIYVLITMRADFLGDCAAFSGFPEALNDGLFLVPRMTRAQLQAAIEGPVGVSGASIAPRLVTQLLNDAGDDPDQLPILQHALMRTWQVWAKAGDWGRPLDVNDYDRTGGMREALSRHGDEIYSSLPEVDRVLAERLFKCLTDRGTDNRGLRHPTRFDDACEVTSSPAADMARVAGAFRGAGCSFVTPPEGVTLTGSTVLDISHESLMRAWTRLQRWVLEEARSGQTFRRLSAAAAAHARSEAGLLRDPELELALRWRKDEKPTLQWAKRYASGFPQTMAFLEESAQARAAELHQRRLRTRRLISVLAVAVIVLIALLTFSLTEWRVARAEADRDNAERVADTVAERSGGSDTAGIGAAEAFAVADTPRTEGAMLDQVAALDTLGTTAMPDWASAGLAARGTVVVAAINAPAGTYVGGIDFGTLRQIFSIANLRGLRQVCGFQNASLFAAAISDHVSVYRFSGPLTKVLDVPVSADATAISCVAPQDALVVASSDGMLRSFDSSGARVSGRRLAGVQGLAASRDGRYIAAITFPANGTSALLHILRLPSLSDFARIAIAVRSCPDLQCSQAAAFNADTSRVAWCDASQVRTAPMRDIRSVSVLHQPCGTSIAFSGPSNVVSPSFYGSFVPLFNPEGAAFLVSADAKFFEQSTTGLAQPHVWRRRIPQNGFFYLLGGDYLIDAGNSSYSIFDLNERTQSIISGRPLHDTVAVSDDGLEAVAVLRDGRVNLLNTTAEGLRLKRGVARSANAALMHTEAVAYNARDRIVTVASPLAVEQLNESGKLLHKHDWSIDCSSPALSVRGTYIECDGSYLLASDAHVLGQFSQIVSISKDERYVFAVPSDPNEDVRMSSRAVFRTTAGSSVQAYALPSMLPVTEISNAAGPIALTTNDKMSAYSTSDGSLKLAEFPSGRTIGFLSPAFRGRHYTDLRFTADDRYLIATYDDPGGRFQDMYAVSPKDWQRFLCTSWGRNLTVQERSTLGVTFDKNDACNQVASD